MPTVGTGQNTYLKKEGLEFRTGETVHASLLYDPNASADKINMSGVFNITTGSFTISGNPVVTGSSAEDSDTLQTVTNRGATTTNALKSQLISITGGGYSSPVGVNGLHLTFDGTGNAYINAQHNGTSNRHLAFNAASYNFNIGDLAVNTDSLYVDVSEDRVGIGTATPAVNLDIYDGSAWAELNLDGANGGEIKFQKAGTTYLDIYASNAGSTASVIKSQSDLRLSSNNSVDADRTLYLDSDGSVGIGTDDPQVKLDLRGDFKQNRVFFRKTQNVNFTNGVANQKVDFYWTGTQQFWGQIVVTLTAGYSNQNSVGIVKKQFLLGLNASNSIYTNDSRIVEADGDMPDNFTISDLRWDSTNSRYYITIVHRVSTGNELGIKIEAYTNREEDIDNFDDVTFGSVYTTDTTAYDKPYVYYNNGLGIGTTNPDRFVVIDAGGGYPLKVNSTQDYMMGLARGGTEQWWFKVNSAGDFTIHENAADDRFRIKTGGKVGIGEADPEVKLEVAGDIMAKDSAFFAGNLGNLGYSFHDLGTGWGFKGLQSSSRLAVLVQGVESMTWESNGRVGIGSTDPALYKLEVAGDISTDRYIRHNGDTNTYFGFSSDDTIQFNTASAERIRITSVGNVGIGTNAPESKFHIYGGNSTQTFSNIDAGLAVENGGSSASHYVFQTATAGGGKSFSITNAGNVGIGTASPTAQLHVHGSAGSIRVHSSAGGANLYLESQSSSLSRVRWNGVSNFAIRDDADGVDRLTINTAGNVGIGTNDPATLLHINGSNPKIRLRDSDAAGTPLAHIDGSDGALKLQADSSSETANSFLTLEVDGYEYMRVTAGGLVGIGTDNPVSKLTIESSANALADVDEPENHHLLLRNPANDTTEGVGMAFLIDANTDDVGAALVCKRIGSNAQSELQFWNKQNTTADGVITQSMTIDEDGNVGIGTNDPAKLLDIDGDTRVKNAELQITSSAAFTTHLNYQDGGNNYISQANGGGTFFRNNGGTLMFLNSAGDFGVDSDTLYVDASNDSVGIGTNAPARNLSVASSSANVVMQLANSTTTYAADNGLEIFVSDSDAGIVNRENGYLRFDTNNTERLRITSAGKVGISGNVGMGTLASDTYRLLVAGTSYFTDTSYWGSQGVISWSNHGGANFWGTRAAASQDLMLASNADWTNGIIVKTDGDVGIGTVTPLGTLHVYTADAGGTIATNASHDDLIIENNGNCGIQFSSPASSYQYVAFGDTASANQGYVRYYHDNNSMTLRAGGIDTLTLSGAKVGIGTAVPSDKLHVWGDVRGDLKLEGNYQGGATDVGKFTYAYAPRGGDHNNRTIASISAYNTTTDSTAGGYLSLSTRLATYTLQERMRVKDDGQVDIYNNASFGSYLFHYGDEDTNIKFNTDEVNINAGNVAFFKATETTQNTIKLNSDQADTDFYLYGNSSTPAIFMQGSDGNVGIGTATASAKVHINGPSASFSEILRLQRDGSSYYSIGLDNNDLNFCYNGQSADASTLVIDGAADCVGIGTKSPAHELDIVGYLQMANTRADSTQKISRMLVPEYNNSHGSFLAFMGTANSASNFVSYGGGTASADAATILAFYTAAAVNTTVGTERMRIDAAGNVGIGTVDPEADLDVDGVVKHKAYAFSSLPTKVAGMRAFINDSYYPLTTHVGQQAANGGSYFVPVWTDGAYWYYG